jgi:hypothetical protein
MSIHPSKATSLRKLALFLKEGGNTPKKSSSLNENQNEKFSISENLIVYMLKLFGGRGRDFLV